MLDGHVFAQTVRIAIEVSVVVTVATRSIEFVDSCSTCAAGEQFANRPVDYSVNRSAARLHDVDRLVAMSVMDLVETVVEIRGFEIGEWRCRYLRRGRCRNRRGTGGSYPKYTECRCRRCYHHGRQPADVK